MAEKSAGAPRFEVVMQSEANPDTQSVVLTMATAGQKKVELEFALGCLPALITDLIVQTGRLLATLHERRIQDSQLLRVTDVRYALRDDGAILLVLFLEGGAELPFEFQ